MFNSSIPIVSSVVGAIATPIVVPSLLGFTKTGIIVGSIAAKMMSATAVANGGGVIAGGVVATLQTIGVIGVSLTLPAVGLAIVGGVISGSVGYGISLLI